jgi:large subunit ribosomal protein L7/L12
MFEIEKIVDQLSNMTLVQASKLTKALEKKLGISKITLPTASPAKSSENSTQKESKSTFDVILKASGQEKIKIIKAVKDITGFGLKESRDRVHSLNNTPLVLKRNIDISSAESLKKTLIALGADVIIK